MRNVILMFFGFLLIVCADDVRANGNDRSRILEIFKAADSQAPEGLDKYVSFLEEDVILMPHDHVQVSGKAGYRNHVLKGWQAGATKLTHQLIDYDSFDDVVIARGKAVGTFQPSGSDQVYPFETKNMFVFKRKKDGTLGVWRVIFNMSPVNAD